jgi:hypothetical protein
MLCSITFYLSNLLALSSFKCSNSAMQLVRTQVGEKSQLRCELFMGNKYYVGIKGKRP